MSQEQASSINIERMIKNLEFMIRMSTKGIFLDELGFKFSEKHGSTKEVGMNAGGIVLNTTSYNYNSTPSICTTMGERNGYPLLLSATTRFIGNVRYPKSNIIEYNEKQNTWAIIIEIPENVFRVNYIHIPNHVVTQIVDITDEAEVFQYTLLENKFPEYLLLAAEKALKLISISDMVDSVTIRGTEVIMNFNYMDMELEFNKKQSSFNNF